MAKKKKESAEFCDYIKYGIAPVIIRNVPEIKHICEKFSGIGEMDLAGWNFLNKVLVECGRESGNYGSDSTYMTIRKEPLKRAVPYTLAHKVREMQTKGFILEHIKELEEASDDPEWQIYKAYMVYSQISVMVGENCQVKKERKDLLESV